MMESWFLLVAAIASEVGGTTCLKLSEGLSRPLPVIGVVALYSLSFAFLASVLKTIDMGEGAAAIWSGRATALIAAAGILVFGEPLSGVRMLSIAFIVLGVAGLQLSGAVH